MPYAPKFKTPTLHTYDGKNSPNPHIYYFRSQTDNVIDNDAIMARLFIGTLMWVAFDWFRSMPNGFINSWTDLETHFLSRFYKDDTKVTMEKHFLMVQKGKESYGNRLGDFADFLLCVLQACHYLCYSRHASITFLIG